MSSHSHWGDQSRARKSFVHVEDDTCSESHSLHPLSTPSGDSHSLDSLFSDSSEAGGSCQDDVDYRVLACAGETYGADDDTVRRRRDASTRCRLRESDATGLPGRKLGVQVSSSPTASLDNSNRRRGREETNHRNDSHGEDGVGGSHCGRTGMCCGGDFYSYHHYTTARSSRNARSNIHSSHDGANDSSSRAWARQRGDGSMDAECRGVAHLVSELARLRDRLRSSDSPPPRTSASTALPMYQTEPQNRQATPSLRQRWCDGLGETNDPEDRVEWIAALTETTPWWQRRMTTTTTTAASHLNEETYRDDDGGAESDSIGGSSPSSDRQEELCETEKVCRVTGAGNRRVNMPHFRPAHYARALMAATTCAGEELGAASESDADAEDEQGGANTGECAVDGACVGTNRVTPVGPTLPTTASSRSTRMCVQSIERALLRQLDAACSVPHVAADADAAAAAAVRVPTHWLAAMCCADSPLSTNTVELRQLLRYSLNHIHWTPHWGSDSGMRVHRRPSAPARAADLRNEQETQQQQQQQQQQHDRRLVDRVVHSLPVIPAELRAELQQQRRLLEQLTAGQQEQLRRMSAQQRDEARRRLYALQHTNKRAVAAHGGTNGTVKGTEEEEEKDDDTSRRPSHHSGVGGGNGIARGTANRLRHDRAGSRESIRITKADFDRSYTIPPALAHPSPRVTLGAMPHTSDTRSPSADGILTRHSSRRSRSSSAESTSSSKPHPSHRAALEHYRRVPHNSAPVDRTRLARMRDEYAAILAHSTTSRSTRPHPVGPCTRSVHRDEVHSASEAGAQSGTPTAEQRRGGVLGQRPRRPGSQRVLREHEGAERGRADRRPMTLLARAPRTALASRAMRHPRGQTDAVASGGRADTTNTSDRRARVQRTIATYAAARRTSSKKKSSHGISNDTMNDNADLHNDDNKKKKNDDNDDDSKSDIINYHNDAIDNPSHDTIDYVNRMTAKEVNNDSQGALAATPSHSLPGRNRTAVLPRRPNRRITAHRLRVISNHLRRAPHTGDTHAAHRHDDDGGGEADETRACDSPLGSPTRRTGRRATTHPTVAPAEFIAHESVPLREYAEEEAAASAARSTCGRDGCTTEHKTSIPSCRGVCTDGSSGPNECHTPRTIGRVEQPLGWWLMTAPHERASAAANGTGDRPQSSSSSSSRHRVTATMTAAATQQQQMEEEPERGMWTRRWRQYDAAVAAVRERRRWLSAEETAAVDAAGAVSSAWLGQDYVGVHQLGPTARDGRAGAAEKAVAASHPALPGQTFEADAPAMCVAALRRAQATLDAARTEVRYGTAGVRTYAAANVGTAADTAAQRAPRTSGRIECPAGQRRDAVKYAGWRAQLDAARVAHGIRRLAQDVFDSLLRPTGAGVSRAARVVAEEHVGAMDTHVPPRCVMQDARETATDGEYTSHHGNDNNGSNNGNNSDMDSKNNSMISNNNNNNKKKSERRDDDSGNKSICNSHDNHKNSDDGINTNNSNSKNNSEDYEHDTNVLVGESEKTGARDGVHAVSCQAVDVDSVHATSLALDEGQALSRWNSRRREGGVGCENGMGAADKQRSQSPDTHTTTVTLSPSAAAWNDEHAPLADMALVCGYVSPKTDTAASAEHKDSDGCGLSAARIERADGNDAAGSSSWLRGWHTRLACVEVDSVCHAEEQQRWVIVAEAETHWAGVLERAERLKQASAIAAAASARSNNHNHNNKYHDSKYNNDDSNVNDDRSGVVADITPAVLSIPAVIPPLLDSRRSVARIDAATSTQPRATRSFSLSIPSTDEHHTHGTTRAQARERDEDHHHHHHQQQQRDSTDTSGKHTSVAHTAHRSSRLSPSPHANDGDSSPTDYAVDHDHDRANHAPFTPAPSSSPSLAYMRDPVTRFVFEWLKTYGAEDVRNLGGTTAEPHRPVVEELHAAARTCADYAAQQRTSHFSSTASSTSQSHTVHSLSDMPLCDTYSSDDRTTRTTSTTQTNTSTHTNRSVRSLTDVTSRYDASCQSTSTCTTMPTSSTTVTTIHSVRDEEADWRRNMRKEVDSSIVSSPTSSSVSNVEQGSTAVTRCNMSSSNNNNNNNNNSIITRSSQASPEQLLRHALQLADAQHNKAAIRAATVAAQQQQHRHQEEAQQDDGIQNDRPGALQHKRHRVRPSLDGQSRVGANHYAFRMSFQTECVKPQAQKRDEQTFSVPPPLGVHLAASAASSTTTRFTQSSSSSSSSAPSSQPHASNRVRLRRTNEVLSQGVGNEQQPQQSAPRVLMSPAVDSSSTIQKSEEHAAAASPLAAQHPQWW